MSSTNKKIVGWINREEWKAVYKELFSDDFVNQRHALDKIAVWKCRTLHKLPTAIECSTELIRAKIMDLQQVELGVEQHEIKLTMAMAVIRFVNLITEKYQNKSFAQPIHTLAEELGLPEWLVDLRHDATHSSLPSVLLLRSAVAFSLGWLQERYWQAEAAEEEEADSSQSDSGCKSEPLDPELATLKMESLLNDYMNIQCQTVSAAKLNKQKKEPKPTRQILIQIESLAVSNREQALHCLVQERFLIPTADQFHLYNISSEDIAESDDLELPSQIIEVWKPCLKLFHHLLLTRQLLQLLSMFSTDSDSLQNKVIAGWIAVIVKNAKDPEILLPKSQKLYNHSFDIDDQILLRNIVKSPNMYTITLMKSIFTMDDCGLDDAQKEELLACIKLYIDPCETDMPLQNDQVYLVKDLVYNESRNDGVREESEPQDDEVEIDSKTWTLATEMVDWSKYPFGTCPGVNINYTNLELFTGNHDTEQNAENEGEEDSSNSMDCDSEADDTHETVTDSQTTWTKARVHKLVNSIKLY